MDLVTIIIPTYNNANYIEDAINSAINQTYLNTEIIVVNDGSTDRTNDILHGFSIKVKVISIINSGGASARNIGIKNSHGKYIKFLDADDILEPNIIEEQIDYMSKLNDKQIVFGDYITIDTNGDIISKHVFNKQNLLNSDLCAFFISNTDIITTCPLHRKTLLDQVGGFDEYLPAGQEVDLHFKLALLDVQFVYRPNIVYRYRVHKSIYRISVSNKAEKYPWLGKYILEKFEIGLLKKNGIISQLQRNALADRHFNYYKNSVLISNKEFSEYHKRKIHELIRFYLPRKRNSRLLGIFYIAVVKLIGFKNIYRFLK